ncbi:MAG: hypothetical protein JJT94_04610 [Bernardetiaceae bacterium]|nr:hypothetical protein [Bernardetiaceae bacterium]
MSEQEFKEWEAEVERIRQNNIELLKEFELWLKNKKLAESTIERHTSNMDFFINEFLVRYEPTEAHNGALQIGLFLGSFLIKKTYWGSKYSIKENIASFKKFYTFLFEKGSISAEYLNKLKQTIKHQKEDWLQAVDDYWDESEAY